MSKLLHHLNSLFRQKIGLPPAPTEQVVDTAPLTELAKAPSQVERNLPGYRSIVKRRYLSR